MIIVFGSLNADMVFPVERLPEPGETVLGPEFRLVAGGKGANQAVAAARAGAETHMVGAVGRDALGHLLLDALDDADVNASAVESCAMASGCAAVCVDARGENQIAVAAGANRAASADQVPDTLLGPDVVVLMQMEVPVEENWRLLRRARAAEARVLLNAAPAGAVPDDVLGDLDVLLVNEGEALATARASGLPGETAEAVAEALGRRYRLSVVVTLGGRGAVAWHEGSLWTVDALPVTPVDTTAAGDAFIGAFAAALDAGDPLPGALHRASVAGGLACTVAGAQTSLPDADGIAARLAELAPARLRAC